MADDPPVDVRKARGWEHTREKIKCELYCLLLAFIPHEYNDHTTKAVTILFITTWSIVTVGIAFGFANPSPLYYGPFSGLVFYFFGRSHGLEVEWLQSMGVTQADNSDKDE